jgi:hypothetical protein
MGRRLAGALLAAVGLVAAVAATALGAFGASVQASGTSLAAYTVPVPANIRCGGLSSLLTSKLAWDAVAPRPGDAVVYVVTAPGGRQTTTAATSYDLPAVTLPGQYTVQAQISSGWRSTVTTITVSLTALGLLYLCSTP